MMFGYAGRETTELMPMPIQLAHRLAERLAEVRKAGTSTTCAPTARPRSPSATRTTAPSRSRGSSISTQHGRGVDGETLIKPDLWEQVLKPVLPLRSSTTRTARDFLVNPTGKFVIGGPVGDAGLTGRKIIVDTYGGVARHGGGAFSGKDPSKVDRSAAYAARYVAKNVVAAGPRRPLRDPGRVRDRRRPAGLGAWSRPSAPAARPTRRSPASSRDVRPAARGASSATSTCAGRSQEDGRLRPLRPRGRRLHLGADVSRR